MLSVIMLSAIMLNVTHKHFILDVVALNVVMLSVVAPIPNRFKLECLSLPITSALV